jgi:hypothetical protein
VPKLLVGYHDLVALNALRHPKVLSGAVVTARTKETLQSKRYNHTRVKHNRTKGQKETQDSPSSDPLAIANDGNRRNGNKRAINTKQAKG